MWFASEGARRASGDERAKLLTEAQEAQRLRRELDDLKVKASAAPGAAKASNVSSREFLDLREALNKKDKEIYLRADKDVPYGFVVKCMGLIREAGIEKINIVTKPLEER